MEVVLQESLLSFCLATPFSVTSKIGRRDAAGPLQFAADLLVKAQTRCHIKIDLKSSVAIDLWDTKVFGGPFGQLNLASSASSVVDAGP